MDALPIETIAFLLLTLAAGGLLVGFLSGVFGIGGGGVLVPVLYEVFRVLDVDEAIRMHMAVGTALAAMIPTTIASFCSHRGHGNVDLDVVRRMALPVIVGVVLGSLIARYSPGAVLKVVWVVVGG